MHHLFTPDTVLWYTKVLNFVEVQFTYFLFHCLCFEVISEKRLPNLVSRSFSPVSSSENFIVLKYIFSLYKENYVIYVILCFSLRAIWKLNLSLLTATSASVSTHPRLPPPNSWARTEDWHPHAAVKRSASSTAGCVPSAPVMRISRGHPRREELGRRVHIHLWSVTTLWMAAPVYFSTSRQGAPNLTPSPTMDILQTPITASLMGIKWYFMTVFALLLLTMLEHLSKNFLFCKVPLLYFSIFSIGVDKQFYCW